MRRRSLRLVVAAIGAGALIAAVAVPAGAQEELGLEINITEGQPGEIVAGQVDTDDVLEHCITDVEAFQQIFLERFEQILTDLFGEPVIPQEISTSQEVALTLVALIVLGVLFDAETAADVLAQTFVFTFADIATQEPVGEMSNFDPETGEGLVTVPDITPGQWAVAAACVSLSTDPEVVQAALSAGAEFLEDEFDVPATFEPTAPLDFVFEFFDLENLDDVAEFLTPIGPTLLEPWVTPDALGAQIFCILDENGVCPTDVVPTPPDDDDDDRVAPPIVIAPVFTG
jgi:hypothetical protein